jgi:hypothetical protein
MRKTGIAIAFASIGLGGAAEAGMRCGNDLVQEGESAAQLLLVCGEPMLRQTIAVENTSKTEGIVEQWTYNFGPGTLLQIVTLEGGKIAKIENGARQ